MKERVKVDGKEVVLVGVSHVSDQSKNDVRETINEEKPDRVFLELDEQRYESLRDQKGWESLNLAEAIKEGKGSLLFFNLVLSVYQRKIGLENDSQVGEEMIVGAETGESIGSEISLIDRPIEETLGRLRSETSILTKIRLALSILLSKQEDLKVEDLNDKTTVDMLVEELDDNFPRISEILLNERNRYMANKIRTSDFNKGVAVIGAGHLEGVREILEESESKHVENTNSRSLPWMKILNYGIPVVIISLLVHTFLNVSPQAGLQALGIWVGLNSGLALIASIIARSHPFTWFTATVGSPIFSLYPGMAAGVVAGYVEAKLNPPTVKELQDIVNITDYRELWGNQAGTVLLTLVLVNIASGLGAILAGLILVGSISGAEQLVFG